MFSTMLSPMLMLFVTSSLVSAGLRCSIGNLACSASCVTLGQTSGICNGEGECFCSEKSIRSMPMPMPMRGIIQFNYIPL